VADENTMNQLLLQLLSLSGAPAFAGLAALAILPARPDDPQHKPVPIPIPLPGETAQADDPHAEMRRLFGKIERDMREIDRLLADASAGGNAGASSQAKQKAADALQGIQKLLDNSEERGKSVVAGIDRILELAQHEPTSSSSCQSAGGLCKNGNTGSKSKSDSKNEGGSQGQSPGDSEAGKSPLDRQGENTTQREATPQSPELGPGKDGSKDGREPKSGQPKKESPKPIGNDASRPAPRNSPANPPPGSSTEAPQAGATAADKWGDLPVHVRDVFRAQGGGDMPAQYRDWIDAYYRRMAKRSGS
jgi:hypothetical protein